LDAPAGFDEVTVVQRWDEASDELRRAVDNTPLTFSKAHGVDVDTDELGAISWGWIVDHLAAECGDLVLREQISQWGWWWSAERGAEDAECSGEQCDGDDDLHGAPRQRHSERGGGQR
jgi:hypothetical protein